MKRYIKLVCVGLIAFILVFIPFLFKNDLKANNGVVEPRGNPYNYGFNRNNFHYDYLSTSAPIGALFELDYNLIDERYFVDSMNAVIPGVSEFILLNNYEYLNSMSVSDVSYKIVFRHIGGFAKTSSYNDTSIYFSFYDSIKGEHLIFEWDWYNYSFGYKSFEVPNLDRHNQFYFIGFNYVAFDEFQFQISLEIDYGNEEIITDYQSMLPIIGDINDKPIFVGKFDNTVIQWDGVNFETVPNTYEAGTYLIKSNYLSDIDYIPFVSEVFDNPDFDMMVYWYFDIDIGNRLSFQQMNYIPTFYEYSLLDYSSSDKNFLYVGDYYSIYNFNRNSLFINKYSFDNEETSINRIDTKYKYYNLTVSNTKISDNDLLDIYNSAFHDGRIIGYDEGYNKGLSEGTTAWSVLWSAFFSTFNVLSIELFPGMTIGSLVAVPLVLGLMSFIFSVATAKPLGDSDNKNNKKGS